MGVPKLDFQLDEDILKDLLFLARNAGRIEDVIKEAEELPLGTSTEKTVQHVAKQTGLREGEVDRLLQTIHNILRTQMRMRIDVGQFLEEATKSFEDRETEASPEEDLKTWKGAIDQLRTVLVRMGPDHPYAVTRKAERISRAHENLLFEAKVITDLRPVFNEAGDSILHSVINHSLIVDYFDGNQISRMEFGLDSADLAELRRVCERAELKAVTLRESLKEVPWAVKTQSED